MAPSKDRKQYTTEDFLELSGSVLGYLSLPEPQPKARRASV